LTDDGRLFHRSDPSNAFISLIERRDDAVGVFVDWHNLVSKHGTVQQIAGIPMWLQAVHGLNIGNKARGVRANPRLLAENFDVLATVAPISRLGLIREQVVTALRLGLRVIRKPSRIKWLWESTRARMVRC
jgi:hypothetical protein